MFLADKFKIVEMDLKRELIVYCAFPVGIPEEKVVDFE